MARFSYHSLLWPSYGLPFSKGNGQGSCEAKFLPPRGGKRKLGMWNEKNKTRKQKRKQERRETKK
jgi:hypothetical protein